MRKALSEYRTQPVFIHSSLLRFFTPCREIPYGIKISGIPCNRYIGVQRKGILILKTRKKRYLFIIKSVFSIPDSFQFQFKLFLSQYQRKRKEENSVVCILFVLRVRPLKFIHTLSPKQGNASGHKEPYPLSDLR